MPYLSNDLPPVPVSSLISYFSGSAITESGEGWVQRASGWVSLGFLSAVPTHQTTWGSVKAKYAPPAGARP